MGVGTNENQTKQEKPMNMIDRLNEIVDKIREHLDAGGGILTESDHDRMIEIIEMAKDESQYEENNHELGWAIWRALKAMQDWNDVEYPYLEDVLPDMFPEGIDDGIYDEV